MSDSASRVERLARLRREPPPLRPVRVVSVTELSPRLRRVRLTGEALVGLEITEPAASVRLLVPTSGTDELVLPEWDGNEFLLPDGERPVIRTFTPPFHAAADTTIDLDVVVHAGGAVSDWSAIAGPGDPAALSGPGRGYEVDPDAARFVLAGDETALPAIRQLLEVLPADAEIIAHIEITTPEARLDLGPPDGGARVDWHVLAQDASPGDAMVGAVVDTELGDGEVVWAAGEAAAVHRLRGHLFDELGLPRSSATVRGYWKQRD